MSLKLKKMDKTKEYKPVGKNILKFKKLLRSFREKNFFYAEHSKYATYVDPEYLRAFETEIVNFSKKWIRMFDQNMSAEKEPGLEGHENTRGLHVMDAEQGAKDVARALFLNEDLARVGAKIHDLGHTAYAHDGEHIISNYLKEQGICEIHHASLATLIIEDEQIHQKVLKKLEENKGQKLTSRELKHYEEAKAIILDIASAHNGEGSDYRVIANPSKTSEDIRKEFLNTFTTPGADKKIVSKTPEGAVVRFNDPIAYVFKDFRDGVISDVVNVDDPEYKRLFAKMGITDQTLDSLPTGMDKKDKIVHLGTNFLRQNLINESMGINGAQMSKDVAELMYSLRSLNNHKVVSNKTKKIMDILPSRTSQLIDLYSYALINSGNTSNNLDSQSIYMQNMLNNINSKQNGNIRDIYSQIVQDGIRISLTNEVNDVLLGENKFKTVRRKRIEEDLSVLNEYTKITDDVKESYISRLLEEINLSHSESQKLFEKRLKKKFPNASIEQLESLSKDQQYLRLETFDECLAKLKVAMYIGESSNTYFLKMLEAEGLLTPEELSTRYTPGGNSENSAINTTMKMQEEDKSIFYSR